MARGWESKAVADQIEEGKEARVSQSVASAVSPEERARLERLASLELSRSRLLEQLEKAKLPAHRSVLLNGLKAIERELEELTGK
jgi:uncharacterized Zn finger protein